MLLQHHQQMRAPPCSQAAWSSSSSSSIMVSRPLGGGVPRRQQQQRRQQQVVVAAAAPRPRPWDGEEDDDDGNNGGERPAAASHRARRIYSLMAEQDRAPIGADHGEGFVRFLVSGVQQVDVDKLNDQMRPAGALRLRHAQHPHEAFGLVFDLDSVVLDLPSLQRQAWAALAEREGLPLPAAALRHPELVHMPPEVACVRLLRWASDRKAAMQLAMAHAELAGQLLAADGARPQDGVTDWLHTLGRFNVPCALVSTLDRATVQSALARMGLFDYFGALVAAEDELETYAQRLLAAAIKLGRAPNQSVAFVGSPRAITAAHNCSLKAVGVAGPQSQYRPHDLKAADLQCGSLRELSVINLRRLWANSGTEHMDLRQQRAAKDDDDDGDDSKRRRRRITNAMHPERDE